MNGWSVEETISAGLDVDDDASNCDDDDDEWWRIWHSVNIAA